MPSPKRRAKTLRGPLTEPEIVELLIGGPVPGQPSAFASPSDFLRARSRLAVEQPEWSMVERWQHERAAIDARFRRHMAAGHPPTDPELPALVDTSNCPLCNPAETTLKGASN
jgi:hypothetical protein